MRSGRTRLVAIHAATDSCYDWDDYGWLVGARFNGHPWTQDVTLQVHDPGHPALAHLGPTWAWHDEVYQFRDLRPDARVLLSVPDDQLDLERPAWSAPALRVPLVVVLQRGRGTGVLHFARAFPGGLGVGGLPPPSGRRSAAGRSPTTTEPRASRPDGDDDLDLDGSAPWEGGHPDGRAGVATGVAEDLVQHTAGPVNDRRLLVEPGDAGDVAGHRQDPLDPIEGPQLGPEHRQGVEGAYPGRLGPLLDGHVRPQGAHAGEAAVDTRKLTGGAGHSAVDDDGVERLMRGVRAVQGQAELADPGVEGGHGARLGGWQVPTR